MADTEHALPAGGLCANIGILVSYCRRMCWRSNATTCFPTQQQARKLPQMVPDIYSCDMHLASSSVTVESDTGGVHPRLKAGAWREHSALPVRKVMNSSRIVVTVHLTPSIAVCSDSVEQTRAEVLIKGAHLLDSGTHATQGCGICMRA